MYAYFVQLIILADHLQIPAIYGQPALVQGDLNYMFTPELLGQIIWSDLI